MPLIRTVLQAATTFDYDSSIAHMILVMHPDNDRVEPRIQIASRYVQECLLKALTKQVHNAANELYTIFNLDPHTRGAAGWLLDPAIHNT